MTEVYHSGDNGDGGSNNTGNLGFTAEKDGGSTNRTKKLN